MTFITKPVCHVCGVTVEAFASDDTICGACLSDRPAFRTARAVFAYKDEGLDLVLQLKHADRTDMARHLAAWMKREGALTGKPVAPDALVRRRATPSQGALGHEARKRNVAGALAV